MRCRTQIWFAFICLAPAWLVLPHAPALAVDTDFDTVEKEQAALQQQIDELIEQLGDSSYATRERAHGELGRIGLAAFDALNRAQEHDDVEIAQRAKFLLRSMQIEWSREDDPPIVQSVLRKYDRLSEADRISRMEQLAGLDADEGVAALCRIVRFEMSLRMSKEAAVRLIKQPVPDAVEARSRRARSIRAAMMLSARPSASWLLTYARTLEDPPSAIDDWDSLVKAEHEAYSLFPDRSRREIVRDLLQFQADLLVRMGRQDEASEAMVRWVDYGDSSRTELLEAIGWLVNRQAWTVVNDLISRHLSTLDDDAELLYLAADAYRKQGKRELADETAGRAAAVAPEDFKEHVRIGSVLRDRGLKDWAEHEYRQVVDRAPVESTASIQAHLYLSEMGHDDAQDLQAAELLKQLVDRIEQNPAIAQQLQGYREPKEIVARMHFFFSVHYHAKGDYKQEAEHLREAITRDPADADVLIGMYHLPGQDDEWRSDVRKRIAAANEQVQQRIDRLQQYMRQNEGAGDPTEQKMVKDYLSASHNEYAWLVGNTEGDFDAAIESSHKSLELRPNYGGFLDTLAHCYAAKKDYVSAVKYQRKAVEYEPHAGQIVRALAKFEEALERSKGTP